MLDQTFTEFELLVIGDGCTDDSERVVSEINDPRLRWINFPRCGHQSGPNNEGLRQARGEYIVYLGHDDLWLRHHLALLACAWPSAVMRRIAPKGWAVRYGQRVKGVRIVPRRKP